jgi:hypothetical protein
MQNTQNTEIRIYSNDTGYCSAAFYAAVILFISVISVVIVDAILSSRTFKLPAPVFSVFIFGLSLLLILILIYKNMMYAFRFAKKPVLVFDSRGITDQTGLFSLGLLHWHQVEEIFCCEVYASRSRGLTLNKENALGILVRDRDGVMSRFGLLARFIIGSRSRPGFFIVRTSGLEIRGNNISALVLKAAKAFPVKVGEFREVTDKK